MLLGRQKTVTGKKKWSGLLLCGFAFLIAAVFLQLAARNMEGFGQWYVLTVYPVLTGTIGRLSGLVPFSVSEILLYLLPCAVLVNLWRLRRQKKRFFAGMFCLASALFFSYTVCCGINYFCLPFSSYLEYQTGEYSSAELNQLLSWLTEQVNGSYGELSGDLQNRTEYSQAELGRLGVEAMETLAEDYPALRGYYPRPKPLLVSWILSVQQLSGIYSPFTVEANYNQEMTAYNIPHTICHELSHLRGFMREDEANFIGFLACIGSEDAEYRYSGYLSGWIYAGNALAKVDFDAYAACLDRLREEVLLDLSENSIFWGRYESKISEAAETVNNTYLKANNQKDGVRSYGRVVDLMLSWYLSGGV